MMGSMRSEVCNGLFRSSTNLAAFENMLSSLSGVAKTTEEGLNLGMPGLIPLKVDRVRQHSRNLKLPRLQHLW